MALRRMDNVGIVVESLDTAIAFFSELGMTLEGRTTIEGEWAGRVTGLGDQRVEIAMLVTPDGHSRLELSRFLTPPVVADHRNAPVNALGYLRVMFTVDDLDLFAIVVSGILGDRADAVVLWGKTIFTDRIQSLRRTTLPHTDALARVTRIAYLLATKMACESCLS